MSGRPSVGARGLDQPCSIRHQNLATEPGSSVAEPIDFVFSEKKVRLRCVPSLNQPVVCRLDTLTSQIPHAAPELAFLIGGSQPVFLM